VTGRPPTPAPERFWPKVDLHGTGGCWLWTAGKDRAGYGVFRDESSRQVGAHRWAYLHLVGPVPGGLELDHLCRNPPCCNPAHLEPVTPRENKMRGIGASAVNAAKTHCIHGHEFTPANTYVTPEGHRSCRTCHREAKARHQAKMNRMRA